MNAKSHTIDERFLLKLYEIAMQKGGPLQEVRVRVIIDALHQKDTAMKNVIKHLAQANFVKKVGDTVIRLTQQGQRFVLNELSVSS